MALFSNLSRTIRAGITKEQWPLHMREVYRILKPGTGWAQCGEMNPRVRCDDGTCPEDATICKVIIPNETGLISSSTVTF